MFTIVRGADSSSAPDMQAVADGTYQKQWEEWLGVSFFGRSAVESCHNQINYSIFRDASGEWVCGEDRYLFSKGQTRVYIQLPSAMYLPEDYDDYARKVARMQAALEGAGKKFVYLLTPTKVETYPEKLPWYDRLAAEHGPSRDESGHSLLVKAFETYGVHYYDCTEDILRMKDEGDLDIFYKTGHHWTLTACAAELNQIFDGIKSMTPGIEYPRVQVAQMVDDVGQYDLDIISGQKLWFNHNRDVHYESPVILYPQTSGAKVYWFGTSYGALFTDALYQDTDFRAFDRLAFQQYFTGLYIFDQNGTQVRGFTPEDTPEDVGVMENIWDNDLIVMEQQADSGIYPTHVKFVDYVNSCLE